jgi:hypothetical protein
MFALKLFMRKVKRVHTFCSKIIINIIIYNIELLLMNINIIISLCDGDGIVVLFNLSAST